MSVNILRGQDPKIVVADLPLFYEPSDIIINSANGCLLHGSGNSALISRESGPLPVVIDDFYKYLLKNLPGLAGKVYREVQKMLGANYPLPTKLQFECLFELFKRNGTPLSQGQSLITGSGELRKKHRISRVVHVVSMTYDFNSPIDPETKRPLVIQATPQILKRCILEAFELIRKQSPWCPNITIPPMCVGRGGLTKGQSLDSILEAVVEYTSLRQKTHFINRVLVLTDNA